jgi:hypothetical protein
MATAPSSEPYQPFRLIALAEKRRGLKRTVALALLDQTVCHRVDGEDGDCALK